MDAVATLPISSLSVHDSAVGQHHINELLPEVLAHIFKLLQPLDPAGRAPITCTPRKDAIGWIRVTCVCRRWRAIALDHPYLWSYIDSRELSPRWTEEFLCRSQMTGVSFLYASYTHRGKLDIARVMAEHLSHIQMLHIYTSAGEDDPSILLSLRRDAPMLKKAELIYTSGYRAADVASTPQLPADLFNNHAPGLRHLEVERFRFAWSSQVFNCLVHLVIKMDVRQESPLFVEPGAEAQDLRDFFGALSRMPALEFLELRDALPPLPTDAMPRSTYFPPVSLPNLRTLDLKDYALKCAIVINHLVIPPTTEKLFGCKLDYVHRRASELIGPWISTQIDTSSSIGILQFMSDRYCYEIAAREYDDTITDTLEQKLLFKVSVLGLYGDESLTDLKAFCDLFSLERLRLVHLDCTPEWSAQDWITSFGQCEDIRSVESLKVGACTLFEALATDNPVEGRTGPLFASLKKVTLANVNFRKDDYATNVPKWLSLRKGPPLESLEIVYSFVTEEMILALHKQVSEFYWDRFGLPPRTEELDEGQGGIS
ncbi:hypothetical protein DENSPDRAFT_840713 [Dentipellis sp. KUC8613]|nr:hypothetical protein DENSPDRAFT_840713 [Dentipellis sp. KUC8613]